MALAECCLSCLGVSVRTSRELACGLTTGHLVEPLHQCQDKNSTESLTTKFLSTSYSRVPHVTYKLRCKESFSHQLAAEGDRKKMDTKTRVFVILILACWSSPSRGEGVGLTLNFYSKSCPKAEEIVKQEVVKLYNEHGNTAVSWVRNLFHDCMVESCDASLLLETAGTILSEQSVDRSFGMRNFKYVNTIKEALERACPATVSCADIVALSAREGVVMLGGPFIPMKTGRRDSKQSHADVTDKSIPNHNDSMSVVLSRFKSIGIDAERTVALLGAHSVGRVHCVNLVGRLYPTVDPTFDPEYAKYVLNRCPSPNPDPEAVLYSRNDRETPMIIDNMYYKNLLNHKGLLKVDQQLLSYPATAQFVKLMAADNSYFYSQFAKAMLLMSENNPLTGNEGEIRRDCRFVNAAA
ncbi:peroxidase 21-like [Zingiber officinale]|uniref:peroxidase n=1 Tax=Zingiber officinale TaxID=94328 RepID=A0A8J5FAG7_ZINOF|nr:peroxidase 21-like [Zingiber officinale]KAG6481490.1 hypothetical protein ZIOFF_058094 [Zingiber officinale]